MSRLALKLACHFLLPYCYKGCDSKLHRAILAEFQPIPYPIWCSIKCTVAQLRGYVYYH